MTIAAAEDYYDAAYYHAAAYYTGTRWTPGGVEEKEISKEAKWSYFYAMDVVKGPWKLGEATISQCGEFSWFYSNGVVQGRWELGEAAISRSNESYSYLYLEKVLGLKR